MKSSPSSRSIRCLRLSGSDDAEEFDRLLGDFCRGNEETDTIKVNRMLGSSLTKKVYHTDNMMG